MTEEPDKRELDITIIGAGIAAQGAANARSRTWPAHSRCLAAIDDGAPRASRARTPEHLGGKQAEDELGLRYDAWQTPPARPKCASRRLRAGGWLKGCAV